jgi:adenylate kinase family enzyme
MTEGTAPSAKEVNEWKTLFISGELQLDSTPVEDTNQLQNTPVVQGSSDVLDEKEFHDYLYYDCDWKLEQDNIVMFNPKIADILENIDNMLNPSEPCPSKPVLESKHPYNIVILGKPLSGKSIICDRLAQELGLVQIDPEAILKQRISKDYQQEDISEFDTKLSELIALAKENLVQGQPIDESIIVQIVLNEITRIEQSVFNINGWIIDGFPNTQTSLALLETHISGNDGNPNKRELKSLIIHKEQEQEPEHQEPFLFRAFTSLIFIDVSNDVIFERASSQKIDPETRQLYHMVYEPPPETDIKLLNRLMPMNELRLDKAQLNKNLQVYNKENKIMINYLVQLGTYNTSAHVVPYPDEQEDSLEQLDTLYAQVKQIVNDDKRAIEQIPPPIQITEPSLNVPASSAGRLSPMSPITTRPGTNVSQPEQPVTVPPTPSPDVLVVAPSVPTVPVPLTLEFATLFDSEWYTMENLYITGVKQVFRLLREQRKVLLHQIHQLKTQFVKFLTQKQVSADVQQLVSTFQTDFNQRFQAQDLRTKKQIKQDMHLRVEELREQLWEISDQKKQEAEAELNSIRDGNSFGSLEKMVIRQYMQLVQLECNRFVHETKFIMDYYFQIYQTDHEEPINIEELFIDVVHVPVEVPSTKRAPTKQVPVKSPEKKTKAKVETRSDSQAETPPQLQLDTNIPSVLDRAKGVITQMEVILATLNPAAAVQEEKLKKPKKKTGKKDEVEEDPKSDENAGPSKEQVSVWYLLLTK